jgi:hypothetical protein
MLLKNKETLKNSLEGSGYIATEERKFIFLILF